MALIAAITLRPRGGETLVQVSQLGDVVEALRYSETDFLWDSLLEATANILLFVPLGAALALRGWSTGRTAICGLALSAAIETAQWVAISGRTTSVDDMVLNTAGAALGQFLLSRWVRASARRRPSTASS